MSAVLAHIVMLVLRTSVSVHNIIVCIKWNNVHLCIILQLFIVAPLSANIYVD